MQNVEKQLDDLLVKKAPFQLPENARKGLANAMPWLTLVGGVLMALAAWGLWNAYQILNTPFMEFAQSWNAYYGNSYVTMGPLVWASIILLGVEAVLFFIAFPALRAFKKSGWNILFYVTLINVVEAIVQIIARNNDFGSLIGSAIGTVIGLYLLFQIRSYYTGEKVATAATPASKPQTPPTAAPKA